MIRLLKKLDEELKEFYNENKEKKNPSVHTKKVKKFLELEGVLDEDDNK